MLQQAAVDEEPAPSKCSWRALSRTHCDIDVAVPLWVSSVMIGRRLLCLATVLAPLMARAQSGDAHGYLRTVAIGFVVLVLIVLLGGRR